MIERDEQMDRDYIPLPGGWEFQTKGKGLTARLCDTKTGDRHPIAMPDFLVGFIEQMAREIHEAHCDAVEEAREERDRYYNEIIMRLGDQIRIIDGRYMALLQRVADLSSMQTRTIVLVSDEPISEGGE